MNNFKIIACINKKLALGKDNELLYHIPSDLKNFKRMTTDNVIIMGRKTLESLPKKQGLPNRINIVISSNDAYQAKNCIVVNSIDSAINVCEKLFSDRELFIIGGSSLYNEFIKRNLVDTMYLTEVDDEAEGDAYFPNFNVEDGKWKLFYQSNVQQEKELSYAFSVYKRKLQV